MYKTKTITLLFLLNLSLGYAQNNTKLAKADTSQSDADAYLNNALRTSGTNTVLTGYGSETVAIMGASNTTPYVNPNTRMFMSANGETHFLLNKSADRISLVLNIMERPAICFFSNSDNTLGYPGAAPSFELNKDGSTSFYGSVWGSRGTTPWQNTNKVLTLEGEQYSPYRNQRVTIGDKRPTSQTHTNYMLSVDGKFVAKTIVQTQLNWADYVFKPDYHLATLDSVADYIKNHGHLPNIPSEKEVKNDGIEYGKLFELQMAKIEELYLHAIAQNRNYKDQQLLLEAEQKKNEILEAKLKKIEERLSLIEVKK